MLHAGGYGSRAARRLLRRHGGASEAEAEADAGDSAPPPVAGIADGGTGHELCSTGVLLRLRAHPSLRDSLLADAPQPLGVLVLLFLLGAAVRALTVEHAIGAARLAALREHGGLQGRRDAELDERLEDDLDDDENYLDAARRRRLAKLAYTERDLGRLVSRLGLQTKTTTLVRGD